MPGEAPGDALQEFLAARVERRLFALVGESGPDARYFEVRGTPVLEDGSLVGAVVRTTDTGVRNSCEASAMNWRC